MSVRNALLGLLGQRPCHGYELHAAFEAVVGGEEIWDVKPAQIYTTLSRLKEAGLVIEKAIDQDGGPEKRVFEITAEGQWELNNWLATPVIGKHQRDEFFVKLMIGLATKAVDPCTIIYTQRASFYQELHDVTAQRGTADPASELAHILMLDKAVMHLEADLRWLDMIEARIEEIRRQPLPEPEPRPRGRPRKRQQ
ncbi:MAG TPA: PadR family transcriptional regulator [Candidatus Aquicultor sp.]|jgi:DNA-binding PadR family transcriptional regulator